MKLPVKTPEYESLEIIPSEDWGIVYGPVQSRRLGVSLGINLLGAGAKACSFNCPYCDLGLTDVRMRDLKQQSLFPSVEQVREALTARLSEMKNTGSLPETISIVGNGEPTVHPEFDEICKVIVEVRDQLGQKIPIACLTNGAHMDQKKVFLGLSRIDERMIKLDAGSDHLLKVINAPLVRSNVSKIVSGARRLKDRVIQAMFIQGAVDNTQPKDIDDWIECVGLIAPKFVHITTINRVPATSGLIPVPEDRLDVIGAQLERRTRIKSFVFVK
ncbi:MAG: radical SAM protein [Bdellovibrionales bacterium]|nr:radical SAM protein [Bdellovibrionales bacterium]